MLFIKKFVVALSTLSILVFASLNIHYKNELVKTNQEYNAKVANIKKQNKDKLNKITVEYSKEINDLKNSIEKLNDDNAKNQENLNNANKTVESLAKENEELKKRISARRLEKEKRNQGVQNNTTDQTSSSAINGTKLTMVATAYSSDPRDSQGGGNITATGQNLLANPMAIAVDPNVIPLGTKLHVEGYGVAYAVDTGGAIKGNIIDIHFPTYEQCVAWGRRTVTVTILSWGDILKAILTMTLGMDVDFALSTDEARQAMIKMLQMEFRKEVNDDNLNELFINYLHEKILSSLPYGFTVYNSHGSYDNTNPEEEQNQISEIEDVAEETESDIQTQKYTEDSDDNGIDLSETVDSLEENVNDLFKDAEDFNIEFELRSIELNSKLLAYIKEHKPQLLDGTDVVELSQDSDQDSIAYIINVVVNGQVDKIVGGF